MAVLHIGTPVLFPICKNNLPEWWDISSQKWNTFPSFPGFTSQYSFVSRNFPKFVYDCLTFEPATYYETVGSDVI